MRNWAAEVIGCDAWTNTEESDLRLQIRLRFQGYPEVLQAGPIQGEELDDLLAGYPEALATLLGDLARSCPGLSLNGVGELLSLEHLRQPMAGMRRWVRSRGITPELCREYKCWFPGDERFLIEVADNGQGCSYVLDREGRVFYHEYGDLPGLLACSLDLRELVLSYFSDPAVLLSPYAAGWVVDPE